VGGVTRNHVLDGGQLPLWVRAFRGRAAL